MLFVASVVTRYKFVTFPFRKYFTQKKRVRKHFYCSFFVVFLPDNFIGIHHKRILHAHVINEMRRLKLNEKGNFQKQTGKLGKIQGVLLFGAVLLFNFHFSPTRSLIGVHALI